MRTNEDIGTNLRRLRTARQLSLGQLTALCGVSKIVLSQIERGSANPTINTIWKIADGLHVHYTELLDQAEAPLRVIKKQSARLQEEDGGSYKSYSYYSASPERTFDLFIIELLPGKVYTSAGHLAGAEEYLIVNKGRLRISVDGQEYLLEEGDGFTFKGDQQHIYENVGTDPVNAMTLIKY